MYIHMCLPRSVKNPIQQLVDITNITCIGSLIYERQLYDCDLNVRRNIYVSVLYAL